MNIKKISTVLPMALFIAAQIFFLFVKDYRVQDYWRYVNDFPLPLSGETKQVEQEFRCPGTLDQIDILLANYKVLPKGGSIQLSIFDKETRLYLKNYPANLAHDNQFYPFPIRPKKPVPKGNYTLRLKYNPANPKDRLAVWIFQKDIYPHGQLLHNNKPRQGDMTFRVFFHSTLWNMRSHVLSKIPKPWLARLWLPAGFILLLVLLNLLFYYILYILLRKFPPRPGP